MKNQKIEFLRHKAQVAHNFIHGLQKRATDYGSGFSEGVRVDCENFQRDNPPPKPSTHIVITKGYLKRLQRCALERLKLRVSLSKIANGYPSTQGAREIAQAALNQLKS